MSAVLLSQGVLVEVVTTDQEIVLVYTMDTTYTHVAPKENADSEVDYIAVVLYKPLLMATGHHAVIECHFVVIPSLKEHRKV